MRRCDGGADLTRVAAGTGNPSLRHRAGLDRSSGGGRGQGRRSVGSGMVAGIGACVATARVVKDEPLQASRRACAGACGGARMRGIS